MKTITPIALRRLMDVGRIELIDVRRQDDFRKVHALGARSVPLRRFEPHSVLAHRKLDRGAPLYLMCDKSMLASAAAGSLSGAGFDKSIVVQGGLEAWLEQGMLVGIGRAPGGVSLPFSIRRTRHFVTGAIDALAGARQCGCYPSSFAGALSSATATRTAAGMLLRHHQRQRT